MTLQILIEKECARMGVSDQEFTRLIGIKKFHKVKPFIEQVKCNQMKKMLPMRHRIVDVLDVTIEQVDEAIQASKDAYYGEIKAAWRASFQPHAVLVTANKIPSPIFVAAITGSALKLYIVPPENLSQLAWPSWIGQAGLPNMFQKRFWHLARLKALLSITHQITQSVSTSWAIRLRHSVPLIAEVAPR